MFKTDKCGRVVCFWPPKLFLGTGWTVRPPSLLLFNLHGCLYACKILLFWAGSISYSVWFSIVETWGPGHGVWTAVAFSAPVKSGPLTCESLQLQQWKISFPEALHRHGAPRVSGPTVATFPSVLIAEPCQPVKCSANGSRDFQGLAWSQGDSWWHSSIDQGSDLLAEVGNTDVARTALADKTSAS